VKGGGKRENCNCYLKRKEGRYPAQGLSTRKSTGGGGPFLDRTKTGEQEEKNIVFHLPESRKEEKKRGKKDYRKWRLAKDPRRDEKIIYTLHNFKGGKRKRAKLQFPPKRRGERRKRGE